LTFFFFNFFDNANYLEYKNTKITLCYFFEYSSYHISRDLAFRSSFFRPRYSEGFTRVMQKYLPVFLKKISIKSLFTLLIKLDFSSISRTLAIAIHWWANAFVSMLVHARVDYYGIYTSSYKRWKYRKFKKNDFKLCWEGVYFFMDVLGFMISGSKLLMQALIEQLSFQKLLNGLLCSENKKNQSTHYRTNR